MQQSVTRSRAYTDDLDEGVAATRAVFGDGVEIAPPERGGTTVAVSCLHSPQLQSIRWHMSGTSRGSRDQFEEEGDQVLAGVLLSGRLLLRTRDGDDLDTSRPFLYPEFVRSEVGAPDLVVLGVGRDLIDAHVRAMTGADAFSLRFTATAPLAPVQERIWRNTMRYATLGLNELAELPADEDADLVSTGLLDLVATQLLHTFPNTALDAERDRSTSRSETTHAALRRAMRYIDDNLDRPFSVVDLAEASGLSLRGLHTAFRRELNATPMRHVRQMRLAAARAALQSGDLVQIDVGALARRWGFNSAEHFERLYRMEYQERPEVTLQRRQA